MTGARTGEQRSAPDREPGDDGRRPQRGVTPGLQEHPRGEHPCNGSATEVKAPGTGTETVADGPSFLRHRWMHVVVAGVTVITAAVYVRALGVGLYSDDYTWAAKMAPTLERPWYVLSVFGRDLNPVLHLSLLLDWLTSHGAAWSLHASSLAVHLACTALLAVLLWQLQQRRQMAPLPTWTASWIAGVTALTWSLNVQLSEAVIWPAARGHALATLWLLGALVCLQAGSGLPVVGGLLVLALMSKETALFALPLLPLLAPRDRRRPTAWLVGGVGGAFVLLIVATKPGTGMSHEGIGALLLKAPYILLRPTGLASFYGFSVLELLVWTAAGAGLVVLLRKRRIAVAGLAWVVLTTLPIVLLPKVSSRYLYLPAVGYALLMADLLGLAARQRSSPGFRRLAGGLFGLLLAVVLSADAIHVQKEMTDYGLLAAPYEACLRALEGPVQALKPHESLVVLDASPRDAHVRLARTVAERGTMLKLIPLRERAVGGLIYLDDAINILKPRAPGLLGSRGILQAPAEVHVVVYDGTTTRELDVSGRLPEPLGRLPRFAASWGPAERYFEQHHQ